MISADELRKIDISIAQNGYNKKEVDKLLDEAADTVDAYINQSEELYHKMEVLASKIEEYRAEEDIIKSAIIKAEKTAGEIRKEAKEKADAVLEAGESKVNHIIAEANARSAEIIEDANKLKAEAEQINAESKLQAEKLVAQARERAAQILSEKTEQCDAIIAEAERKANEAINSSKIVAQNILDQAKEISMDLLEKSKDEKEAYELLVNELKNDAKSFLEKVKSLYREQLEILDGAKLERDDEESIKRAETVYDLQEEVESLVSEMEEMESAIPDSIKIEEDAPEPVDEITDEPEEENEAVSERVAEPDEEEEFVMEVNEPVLNEDEVEIIEDEAEIVDDEEPVDPMEAVEAFSSTPKQEEKSLFDNNDVLPFENYFNVNHKDVHGDKNEVISLIPPEDDEDDQPKFRGLFKKKK